PGGDRMAPALGAAFAAAMGVIDRVHRRAADMGALALPDIAAGLADDLVHVVGIGHRAHRRHAGERYLAHFRGIEPHQGIAGVAAQILGIGAGGAGDLAALARLHFDIVDDGADRQRREWHGIADLDVDLFARDHAVAHGQALRRQNIGLLAILVLDQGDEGGAIGIIFQPLDDCRLVEFAALEIDQAIALLVTAALVAHHDAPGVVAPALGVLALGQRLDRTALVQAGLVHQHQLALAWGRGFVLFQSHGLETRSNIDLVALFQGHDRFFEIAARIALAAGELALALD